MFFITAYSVISATVLKSGSAVIKTFEAVYDPFEVLDIKTIHSTAIQPVIGNVAIVVADADENVVVVVFVIASPIVTVPVKVGDALGAYVVEADEVVRYVELSYDQVPAVFFKKPVPDPSCSIPAIVELQG